MNEVQVKTRTDKPLGIVVNYDAKSGKVTVKLHKKYVVNGENLLDLASTADLAFLVKEARRQAVDVSRGQKDRKVYITLRSDGSYVPKLTKTEAAILAYKNGGEIWLSEE